MTRGVTSKKIFIKSMSNYKSFLREVDGTYPGGGLQYVPKGKAGEGPRSKYTMFRSQATRNILNLINRFTGSSSIKNSHKQMARNARQKLAQGGTRKNAINSLKKIAETIHLNNIRNFDQDRLTRDIQNRKRRVNAALAQGNITQNQAANFKAKLNGITLNTSRYNKEKTYEEVTRAIKMKNFRRQINQANISQNRKNKLLSLLNSNKSSEQIRIALNTEKRLVEHYKIEIGKLNAHIKRLQSSNDPNKQNKIRNTQRIRNTLKSQLYKTNIFTNNYRNAERFRIGVLGNKYVWTGSPIH